MIWASYKGHVNIVKELLHYGADHRQCEQVIETKTVLLSLNE